MDQSLAALLVASWLAVEAEARARFPVVRGFRGRGISGAPEAQARGASKCHGEAGADEPAHFRVRPLPLGGQARGEPLASSLGLRAVHPVHREHERGEVTPPGQAGREVLVTFLLLVALEDLGGIQAAGGRGIRVGDSDVKDGRRPALPEAVRGDVASQIWGSSAAGPCATMPS